MHFSALKPLLFALLPATAWALPHLDDPASTVPHLSNKRLETYIAANNITVTTGFVDNSAQSLSTRGIFDGPPDECRFMTKGNYYYTQFHLLDREKACWGHTNEVICSNGPWSSNERASIRAVLDEQVIKDGQWKSSNSGRWSAVFQLGTTAFSNRDTSLFEVAMDMPSYGQSHFRYYWHRDGDNMELYRNCGCV